MAYDVEREPGSYAKEQEWAHTRVALVFFALVIAAAILGLSLILLGTAGLVSSIALLVVAYVANELFDLRLEGSTRWGKGANGERAVGETLASLRREGYVVMHDLDKVVPGNVDHLVSGPSGVFMVETKFKRYNDPDIPKAKWVAKRIADELGIAWVQPVICCATRSYGPIVVDRVAVVGRQQLLPYVRSQQNPVVPFKSLAAFADRQ